MLVKGGKACYVAGALLLFMSLVMTVHVTWGRDELVSSLAGCTLKAVILE
jgi:hypothetical protein